MGNYPLHEKLAARREEHKAICEFLEWLDQHDQYRMTIDIKGDPDPDIPFESEESMWRRMYGLGSIRDLIAAFFGIDPREFEKERQRMLDEFRAGGDQK